MVGPWLDQGRNGVPPRTHPGRHPVEYRDPHSCDGPQVTAVLRGLLVPHPGQQRRDSPRGIEGRCATRRIARTPRRTTIAGACRLAGTETTGRIRPPGRASHSRGLSAAGLPGMEPLAPPSPPQEPPARLAPADFPAPVNHYWWSRTHTRYTRY